MADSCLKTILLITVSLGSLITVGRRGGGGGGGGGAAAGAGCC